MLVLPLSHVHHGRLIAIIPSTFEAIAEGASDDILPHSGGDIARRRRRVRGRRWKVGRHPLHLARVRRVASWRRVCCLTDFRSTSQIIGP